MENFCLEFILDFVQGVNGDESALADQESLSEQFDQLKGRRSCPMELMGIVEGTNEVNDPFITAGLGQLSHKGEKNIGSGVSVVVVTVDEEEYHPTTLPGLLLEVVDYYGPDRALGSINQREITQTYERTVFPDPAVSNWEVSIVTLLENHRTLTDSSDPKSLFLSFPPFLELSTIQKPPPCSFGMFTEGIALRLSKINRREPLDDLLHGRCDIRIVHQVSLGVWSRY